MAVVGEGVWEFALLFNKRLLCAVMMLEMFGIELQLIFKVFLLKILFRIW